MPSEKLPVPSRNNLVERREFLSGAATLAGASLVGGDRFVAAGEHGKRCALPRACASLHDSGR